MATQHNFRIKNGLEIAGVQRISSAGVITGALDSNTTATTQSASDNSTKIATTAYTDAAITAVIGGAPGTLDTLNELAAAINDDASYASTLTTALAGKLPLAGGTMTGALVVQGGNANNTSAANTVSATGSQHVKIVGSTSSSGGHRATLELTSNSNTLSLSTTGTNSYLTNPTGTFNLQIATDKVITFAPNIGEIGSVTGFQATNTAGSANTDFGIRATTIRLATGSSEKVRVAATGHLEFNPVNSFSGLNNSILSSSNTYMYMMGGAAGLYLADNANLSNSIGIRNADYIDFNTGGTGEKMRLDSSGDLNMVRAGSQSSINFTTDGSLDYARITGGKYGSGVGDLRFFTYSGGMSERMSIDNVGKIKIGNNIPMWSGSYGGALFLKGNNSTSDRYARICTVDSTGAAINNGLTVNNDGSTTIDCGQTYSLNISGNNAGLRFSTGTNQRIYFNTHRAIEGNSDGSIIQMAEGYTQMLVQAREKYSVDGAIYGRVIIRFAASTSGDRLTAITANMNTLLGLSTGQYGSWQVEFGGYAGSGANGCTGSFNIGGYTGHNYSATNHNSYGAGTINVGYSSTAGASTGAGPLSYHPVQNNGMYIANGEVWVYVPASQQVGIMIKNNSSQSLYGTMTVTGTIRN